MIGKRGGHCSQLRSHSAPALCFAYSFVYSLRLISTPLGKPFQVGGRSHCVYVSHPQLSLPHCRLHLALALLTSDFASPYPPMAAAHYTLRYVGVESTTLRLFLSGYLRYCSGHPHNRTEPLMRVYAVYHSLLFQSVCYITKHGF